MVYNKPNAEVNFEDAKMRNNMEHFREMIQNEAENITNTLGECRLAITQRQYEECILKQNLGVVTEFHGLGDLSNLFHTPVPFLEEDQLVRRKPQSDDLFQKLPPKEIHNKNEQLERFRSMFKAIMDNILKLVEHDKNN